MTEAARRWHQVAADASLAPPDAVRAAFAELWRRYGEAPRHYHDRSHVRAVLRTLDALTAPAAASAAVRLTAWFHDAVYDPKAAPGDNEARSAALAGDTLASLGADPSLVTDVASLIGATAAHRLEGVAVAQADVFLDADLAVLGAAPADYDRYADAIRREYGHLEDDAYHAGRIAVLERFVQRERLYFSVAGAARFEAPARANLARELASLRAFGR